MMRLFPALAPAFALALALGGPVHAATYTLGGAGGDLGNSAVFNPTGSGPLATITAGSSGIFNGGVPTIVQTGPGLGVNGSPDFDPFTIDGSPIGSSEFLTVTFGWAVRLLSFGLAGADGNDQYDISINGGPFSNGINALASNSVGQNFVTSFTIRASGTFPIDGLLAGNDEFRLASIQTASVPLPAAAGLLAAALAALGLAGTARRRSAA
jgi:hypothetical protein